MARGGARIGAGRKSVASEEKTKELCKAAIQGKYGSVENGIKKLLESNEPSLIKFVYEHALGKPTDEVNLKSDGEVVKAYTIGKASEQKSDGK